MTSRFDAGLLARAVAAVRRGPAPTAGAPDPAQPARPEPSAVQIAADICRRFEGLYLRPYLCPAGVWTIGYGSTRYPDGRAVSPADPPITAAQAEAMLQHELAQRLPQVLALCPGADSSRRRGSVLDFAFNAGIGALRASTLRRRVNAQDWPGAAGEMRRWVRGGGRVLPGLVRRREVAAVLLL